jgi:TM2 domain-containing membrane protein YozV/Tfp pilus assembly major pilin PilA
MSAVNPYSAPGSVLESDQKVCESCGSHIKVMAEICPACGVRQRKMVSKTALLLLAFFLGGFGAHKFYLGKWVQGIFYLLFCWTGIPGLIALIEFIVYACTSSESLNEKYSAGGGGVVMIVIVAIFGFIFILGILAAVSIPAYQDYTVRARVSETMFGLSAHKVMVAEYFAEKRSLPVTGAEIDVSRQTVPRTQSVRIGPGGTIVATFSAAANPSLAGKSIVLTPEARGDTLVWTCLPDDASIRRYMPASCR